MKVDVFNASQNFYQKIFHAVFEIETPNVSEYFTNKQNTAKIDQLDSSSRMSRGLGRHD